MANDNRQYEACQSFGPQVEGRYGPCSKWYGGRNPRKMYDRVGNKPPYGTSHYQNCQKDCLIRRIDVSITEGQEQITFTLSADSDKRNQLKQEVAKRFNCVQEYESKSIIEEGNQTIEKLSYRFVVTIADTPLNIVRMVRAIDQLEPLGEDVKAHLLYALKGEEKIIDFPTLQLMSWHVAREHSSEQSLTQIGVPSLIEDDCTQDLDNLRKNSY